MPAAAGIHPNVYLACLRILVASGLLEYAEGQFLLTRKNEREHRKILEKILAADSSNHCKELFRQAREERRFFFEEISELEYEIYARYNFQQTFNTGKQMAGHVDLTGKNVLELGGNSGGLGSALLTGSQNCRYTVLDTRIPCAVGRELTGGGGGGLTFIEGDFFSLELPQECYDIIVLMNVLHDFGDEACDRILQGCRGYTHKQTRFLVIEDILTGEFAPKAAVMHGLRLSVSCRGGRQRQEGAVARLFSKIQYKLERAVRLNACHSLLVMGPEKKGNQCSWEKSIK